MHYPDDRKCYLKFLEGLEEWQLYGVASVGSFMWSKGLWWIRILRLEEFQPHVFSKTWMAITHTPKLIGVQVIQREIFSTCMTLSCLQLLGPASRLLGEQYGRQRNIWQNGSE